MKHLFTSVFVFLLVQTAWSQTLLKSIMHDGIQRDYRVYVPSINDGSTEVPLVFNLHGLGSNAAQQEFYGNFTSIADTANFILVAPDGTLNTSNTTFWNAFGSPTETVDDIGFLSALIDTIASDYSINLNRVYSTGMSNGGFMSYRLACQLSNRIAAIASVTGAMIDPAFLACNPVHPTPVMQVHGTVDPTVPYGGGTGFLGAEAGVAYWVDYNNCNSTAIETAVPDMDQTDGCTADRFVYSGGDAGSTVELYRINGGAHTWPGAPIDVGVTNQDFFASVEIWRFFSQYRLNELVGVEEVKNESSFSVYPNPSENVFTIQFEKVANRSVQIHNSVGQLVKQFNTNSNSLELNLEELGMYLLTVISEEGILTKKLIVK
jgi:polyhydroxybutyrate depolymerase